MSSLFNHYFDERFRAQLVRGFALKKLLDKPWSQVPSLLPPGTRTRAVIYIVPRVQHSHFQLFYMLIHVASNFANSCSRAFGPTFINTFNGKNESLAGLEPTTSTSVNTRLTI